MAVITRATRARIWLHWSALRSGYGLTNLRHAAHSDAVRVSRSVARSTVMMTTPPDCVALYHAVKACEKLPGDMAEGGVYTGATAALMLAAAPSKRILLFDTFEGLPHGEDAFEAGEYEASPEVVRRKLGAAADRADLHPGLFPDSAAGLEELRFCFVHLDFDLYDSTLAALEWFWPRMTPGGVILSHDYPLSAGVVRAFHDFFDPRPETYLPTAGNNVMAVKV